MGNRILKESIRMSEQIDSLSWFEETVFYRLIVTVDDYGVYHANPVLLAHILFPMKENVDKQMMVSALEHMEQLGLIRRYHVKGKGDFLRLVSWEKHQRLRNSRHAFPMPGETESVCSEASDEEHPAERPVQTAKAPESEKTLRTEKEPLAKPPVSE